MDQRSDTEKVFIQSRDRLFSEADDPWLMLNQFAYATGILRQTAGRVAANVYLLLGRLQFEIIPSEFHYEHAGCILRPYDSVINVHTPSFGHLEYGYVLDAYCRAVKFFGHLFPKGNVCPTAKHGYCILR